LREDVVRQTPLTLTVSLVPVVTSSPKHADLYHNRNLDGGPVTFTVYAGTDRTLPRRFAATTCIMEYDDLLALRAHLVEELEEAGRAAERERVKELHGMIERVDQWIPEAALRIDRRVRFEGLEVDDDRRERFRALRRSLPLN